MKLFVFLLALIITLIPSINSRTSKIEIINDLPISAFYLYVTLAVILLIIAIKFISWNEGIYIRNTMVSDYIIENLEIGSIDHKKMGGLIYYRGKL